MVDTKNADGYVFDRTVAEYDRLRAQADIWVPLTERVLDRAGLTRGMTALDAGCGPGEVMRLMARRVGPQGHVTGIDIDAQVGTYGLSRLQAEETGAFAFHATDLTKGEDVPGAPFDVVFCRFLLIHMDDPVAMVRRLARLVKPGGTLIVMDYVMDAMQVSPPDPTLNRSIDVVLDTFRKRGCSLNSGVRFGEWFRAAGLPMPDGTDIEGRLEVMGREDPMLARSLESLTVPAVGLGASTADEMAHLPQDVRTISAKGEHLFHWPTVTAAWARVPG